MGSSNNFQTPTIIPVKKKGRPYFSAAVGGTFFFAERLFYALPPAFRNPPTTKFTPSTFFSLPSTLPLSFQQQHTSRPYQRDGNKASLMLYVSLKYIRAFFFQHLTIPPSQPSAPQITLSPSPPDKHLSLKMHRNAWLPRPAFSLTGLTLFFSLGKSDCTSACS